MAKVEQAIASIVEKTEIEGTSASIIERSTFLPLEPAEPHDRLFAHYQSAAAELGLAIEREYTGGSTDSGFTASIGAPSLCGTGPGGEMLHQPEEVCHIDALIPRAQALALAILRLGS
jgi:glutamate carboxypeptidase